MTTLASVTVEQVGTGTAREVTVALEEECDATRLRAVEGGLETALALVRARQSDEQGR